jgi:3'-phosphoadenosine 5'-phosphosulfate sulfotransferase (PAPS reductase)/FAD synthetase
LNNVLSISGGKDSTDMLLEMLERGETIHSAVFFDTGWEFPAMYEHIERLQEYTGIKIWTLQSRLPFDYWMMARPIIARKGPNKGKVARIGNGWPSPSRRWCTRQKVDAINYYVKPIENAVQCVGYAADETDRSSHDENIPHRFPLQEYGITEKTALDNCYRHGFDWGGLYNHFRRVSCFCCPLQRIGELRTLRREFPELWSRMLKMETDMLPGTNRGFKDYKTVHDFEKRFACEDQQINMFHT